jgi:hypothetical protein
VRTQIEAEESLYAAIAWKQNNSLERGSIMILKKGKMSSNAKRGKA